VAKRLEQRRHELAPGQVAGAAKENKVKGHESKVTKLIRINVTLFLP
jgi:hypothetical protein